MTSQLRTTIAERQKSEVRRLPCSAEALRPGESSVVPASPGLCRAGCRPSDQGWPLASGLCQAPPKRYAQARRPASAFTLLEVMLVVGIIAILALLLFPVVIRAGAKAKEKQAMAETRAILMAIKAYRQEYGKWPAQFQAAGDTTYIISNYCVIQPLLGSNWNGFNPKNKIFLNLQVNMNNNPDYAGNYLDPWGIPYVICMDENGDNQLSISNNVIYLASNQVFGATNINLTANCLVDVGVASLGSTPSALPWNTWTEMQ
ncbi:MAG: type II secretion system protein [Fibrobacterota bacterium]